MKNRKPTEPRLTMTWVPVRDKQGRVHMEARWTAHTGRPSMHQAA